MNIVTALLLCVLQFVCLQEGEASWYVEGKMDEVIYYRQRTGVIPQNLDKYVGFVAARECSDLGKELWLRPVDGEFELYLITDCAGKSDQQNKDDPRSGYQWMLDGNIVVEVDWETKERLGLKHGDKRVEIIIVDKVSNPLQIQNLW